MIKIFQKVGNYEDWEGYQNLPKGWIMKAGYMIKIFRKEENYEGWLYDQNVPKGRK